MGVKGLWKLLESTGQPIVLETLENQVLSIDFSIWLNESLRGMRDHQGSLIQNAHLLGLFYRICKLLFFKIRPVFVFDGGAPLLKMQTMSARRRRKELAIQKQENTINTVLQNYMKKRALSHVTGNKCQDDEVISIKSSRGSIFELPPLPSMSIINESNQDEESNSATASWDKRCEMNRHLHYAYGDLSKIDLQSEDFQALPAEIQHEIVLEVKSSYKSYSMVRMDDLPRESKDFSNYQLDNLRHRSRLTQQLDHIRRTLNAVDSDDVNKMFDLPNLESRRVVSEDDTHYLLVKNQRERSQDPTVDYVHIGNKRAEVDFAVDQSNKTQNDQVVVIDKSGKNLQEKIQSNEGTITYELDLKGQQNTESEVSQVKSTSELAIKSEFGVNSATEYKFFEDIDIENKSTEDFNKEVQPTYAEDVATESNVNMIDNFSKNSVEKTSIASSNQKELSATPVKVEYDRKVSEHKVTMVENSSDSEGEFIEVEDEPYNIVLENPHISIVNEAETMPSSVPPTTTKSNSQTVFEVKEEEDDKSGDSEAEVEQWLIETVSEWKGADMPALVDLQRNLEEEGQSLVNEHKRQERMAASISDEMYSECQELLTLFGVPFIVSPMEAEAQCAFLELTQQTDGTITDDSDIFLFGGCKVYRNVFRESKYAERYSSDQILRHLGLDRQKMIFLAYLLGSDYTEGIKNVGIVLAMELLSTFGGDLDGLEKLKKRIDDLKSRSFSEKQGYQPKLKNLELRDGFPDIHIAEAYMNPVVDKSKAGFEWAIPDLDGLRQFTHDKFFWSQSKTDDILLPLLRKLSSRDSKQQSDLLQYFPVIHNPEPSIIKSKRLRRVVNYLRNKYDEVLSTSSSDQHGHCAQDKPRKRKKKASSDD